MNQAFTKQRMTAPMGPPFKRRAARPGCLLLAEVRSQVPVCVHFNTPASTTGVRTDVYPPATAEPVTVTTPSATAMLVMLAGYAAGAEGTSFAPRSQSAMGRLLMHSATPIL
jgi:hypothetical protein